MAFLLAFVPAFVLPVGHTVNGLFAADVSHIPWLQDMPASVGTIILLLLPAVFAFLVFAYIAGHLFYRQDPKAADIASFDKIHIECPANYGTLARNEAHVRLSSSMR